MYCTALHFTIVPLINLSPKFRWQSCRALYSISPEVLVQLVRAEVAILPAVAQPGYPEYLKELLRLVELAGEVSLLQVEPEQFGSGQHVRQVNLYQKSWSKAVLTD